MLYYLIYISKATRLMSPEELTDILNVSQDWNKGHDITGMLLYVEGRFLTMKEGRFMQVLEGNEQEVKAIFKSIKKDSRHHGVIILKEEAAKERLFKDWTMGFESVQLHEFDQLPGFFELDNNFLSTVNVNSSPTPLDFLKTFYEMRTY